MANIKRITKIEKVQIETSISEISKKIGMKILEVLAYDSCEISFSVILPLPTESCASLTIENEELISIFDMNINKNNIDNFEIVFENDDDFIINYELYDEPEEC